VREGAGRGGAYQPPENFDRQEHGAAGEWAWADDGDEGHFICSLGIITLKDPKVITSPHVKKKLSRGLFAGQILKARLAKCFHFFFFWLHPLYVLRKRFF
jgi:hypothetical protein